MEPPLKEISYERFIVGVGEHVDFDLHHAFQFIFNDGRRTHNDESRISGGRADWVDHVSPPNSKVRMLLIMYDVHTGQMLGLKFLDSKGEMLIETKLFRDPKALKRNGVCFKKI